MAPWGQMATHCPQRKQLFRAASSISGMVAFSSCWRTPTGHVIAHKPSFVQTSGSIEISIMFLPPVDFVLLLEYWQALGYCFGFWSFLSRCLLDYSSLLQKDM
jgi:hypothetical protein